MIEAAVGWLVAAILGLAFAALAYVLAGRPKPRRVGRFEIRCGYGCGAAVGEFHRRGCPGRSS